MSLTPIEHNTVSTDQLNQLAEQIKTWGQALGFQKVGISDIDLAQEEPKLQAWLDQQYHGNMEYMARYGMMRARPNELHPGTVRVISVRLDYLPENAAFAKTLKDKNKAFVSRYAVGRDYHKVIRNKLKQLGKKIEQETGLDINFRPFVDSAPIMERPLAEKAGLGWTGKHSLILDKQSGSWFFLGELLVNLPLPVDKPVEAACGSCVACMTICPTQAIVAPYTVDARRCISYLTIELQEDIPVEFRRAIGNRIYGCDDCQLICPWNRYAQVSPESDFQQRAGLLSSDLLLLWQWDEVSFLKHTEGSAIRRIGFQRWLRNLAVGLGNADYHSDIVSALLERQQQDVVSDMVKRHIEWALTEQQRKREDLAVEISSHHKKTARLVRAVEKGLSRDA